MTAATAASAALGQAAMVGVASQRLARNAAPAKNYHYRGETSQRFHNSGQKLPITLNLTGPSPNGYSFQIAWQANWYPLQKCSTLASTIERTRGYLHIRAHRFSFNVTTIQFKGLNWQAGTGRFSGNFSVPGAVNGSFSITATVKGTTCSTTPVTYAAQHSN